MKLHLPKKLLKALIIAASAVLPLTSAAETEVWVNFGGTDKGVTDNTKTWNNILGNNAASLSGSYTLVDVNGASAGNLVLSANANPWGYGNAPLGVLKGYLDYQAQDKSTYWSLNFMMDDIAATNISVNLYNSGDGGNPIAPVIVNGKSYVGNTTSENVAVNLEGTASWGNALTGAQQTTLNKANTVSVTGLGGVVNIAPAQTQDWNNNGETTNHDGRFTLAGLSIVWDGSTSATSITLNSGVNDASSHLQGVEAANRVYSLSGNADGTSSFNIAAGEVVQGLQSAANTVTVTSDGAISVGQLFAKAGSTLNMNAAITSGADLNIGGFGRVNIGSNQVLQDLTASVSTLGISSNATLTIAGNLTWNGASIEVEKNAVLDLSALTLEDAANTVPAMTVLRLINTASGEGTIKLKGGYINSAAQKLTMTFNTNYEVGTDENALLSINCWHDRGSWKTHTVTDKGSITVGGGAGTFELLSGQKLLINGGSVAAGKLVLGHSDNNVYSGALEMTSGFLTVGEIYAQNQAADDWKNTILLTSGTLTVTGNQAITYASAARTDVTFGGSGDSSLILKTAGSDFSVTKGSAAGSTLTIGNITIDEANTNMITIDSAAILGTIVNNATAEGAGLTLSGDFTVMESNVKDTYTQNGFDYEREVIVDNFTGDGNYVFADGVTINGVAFTDFTKNGSTYSYSGSATGTIYHVVNAPFTVDGSDNNVAKDATGYVVHAGQTLTLQKNQSTTMTASKILAETIGEGNITVDCDFTYANGSSSKATGILTIEEGHTLQLGAGTGHVVSIASFNQVVLNGSTLKLHNNGTTIQNLTVDKASTLHLEDTNKTNNVPNAAHLTGITNLQAELDVTNGFKGRLVIDSLTGKGNLDIDLSNNPYVANGDSLIVDINEISNYSGIISYKPAVDTSVADAAAAYANNRITITSTGKGFSIGGLEVTGGVYDNRTASGAATIDIGGDTSLGAVKLGQGSSLTIFNRGGSRTVTMNSLAVDGSAIIQTQRDPNCHNSTINIGELTGTDATLTLKNGSKTTNATVYNLKGGTNQQTGTFSGVINLEGNAEGTSTRPVELLLSNAAVAEKAVINFQNSSADVSQSQYNQMYLKLGVDGAKVAGLRGETTNAAIIASASGTRTLHIVAAENADNTTNATINAGVNLMKSGAGKQTFSGDMSAFNGSIMAVAGELSFTATEALSVNNLSVANVGTLTVANGETAGSIIAGGAVTLAGGAVINGNLDLNTATDVNIVVTPTPSAGITLNGALTMSSTEAFVAALGNSLAGLTAGEMLTVFTGVSSFTVGDVTYSAESENQLAGVDLSTWSSDVAVGQYTMTYNTSADVGSIVITAGAMIPEPTTATLSLLALMGLAARRRRK